MSRAAYCMSLKSQPNLPASTSSDDGHTRTGQNATANGVTNWRAHADALQALLQPYGLDIVHVRHHAAIPGSYWGDSEAGLIGNQLYLRDDTPLHSALHEACHYLCMDEDRRAQLHTDAAGDYAEENAVCYLQIVLADQIADYGRKQMFTDMDAWGYSFRLGSAQAWFERDAEDARLWLLRRGLL